MLSTRGAAVGRPAFALVGRVPAGTSLIARPGAGLAGWLGEPESNRARPEEQIGRFILAMRCVAYARRRGGPVGDNYREERPQKSSDPSCHPVAEHGRARNKQERGGKDAHRAVVCERREPRQAQPGAAIRALEGINALVTERARPNGGTAGW